MARRNRTNRVPQRRKFVPVKLILAQLVDDAAEAILYMGRER